jgi:5'-nucleotidase
VWVVAPEHDQSGVSHAVSLHHPIRISERGLRVTGSPVRPATAPSWAHAI